MTVKSVSLPEPIKLKLRQHAYENYTSMSEVIRDIVRSYVDGQIPTEPKPPKERLVEVNFEAPEEWGAAVEKARQDGTSLASVLREEIIRRTEAA